jgi:hypothetical protein
MDADHRPLLGPELDDPKIGEVLPETGVGIPSEC